MTDQLPAIAIQRAPSDLGFLSETYKTFAGTMQLGTLISKMDCCPEHLKGKPEDCFRVVCMAARWGMDPFMVAECTSVVYGRLCLEGKLVAAVLRAMGAITGRLEYELKGRGQDAEITVTGTPTGSAKACSIHGSVKNWRTQGKDRKTGQPIKNAWDTMPETMLHYKGTRQWARLFTPEAVLGVSTPDEVMEPRDVTEGMVVLAEVEPARVVEPEKKAEPAPAPARAKAKTRVETAPEPETVTVQATVQATVEDPVDTQVDTQPDTATAPTPAPAPTAETEVENPVVAKCRAFWNQLRDAHKVPAATQVLNRLSALAGGARPSKADPVKLTALLARIQTIPIGNLAEIMAFLNVEEMNAAPKGTP